jgi:hypothetical protein
MVDDDDLIAESRAEAGIFVAIDADIGADVVADGDCCPPVTKAGPIAGHAAAHDGNQAPTGFQP